MSDEITGQKDVGVDAADNNEVVNSGKGSRRGKRRTSVLDKFVGIRLRALRNTHGLSQEKLGEMIGLTFQQVQKYESGANRISASRLYEIAQAFSVDINFFFEEIPLDIAENLGRSKASYVDEKEIEHRVREGLYVKRVAGIVSKLPENFRDPFLISLKMMATALEQSGLLSDPERIAKPRKRKRSSDPEK
ncbi:helix-turn-helix domain-containing protein [Thalassospira xiamenensis]|uniref:Transcriptional regulator, contains XRE-family HTH domain n=1 Tax=Thalassospira xiamenensis TaxID=220697 RepID=A0A285TL78_9PROT|nr:helix-turn-helix transcriptional regulator [Thalassospira xiamenensis]SOC21456.1 Transcriptional regulator, contains XRE-family HTH domain [Thalassospira xiamenensis]